MSNFTQEKVKAALTSIADGSVIAIQERDNTGIFKHLHTHGYITGDNAGLNGFQRINLALTQSGHQFLRSN